MNKIFFKKELHVYIDSVINSKPVLILPEKEIIYDDPHDPRNWDEIKLLSFDNLYNDKRYDYILSGKGYLSSKNGKRRYRYIEISGKQYKKSDINSVILVRAINDQIGLGSSPLSELINNITIDQFEEWIKDIAKDVQKGIL